jgi:hypothetical protein
MGETGIVGDVTGLSKDEGRTAVVHSNRFLVHALPMDRASASRHEASRRRKRTDAMNECYEHGRRTGKDGRKDGRTDRKVLFPLTHLKARAEEELLARTLLLIPGRILGSSVGDSPRDQQEQKPSHPRHRHCSSQLPHSASTVADYLIGS